MTQGVLPFKLEEEKKEFGVSGKIGLMLFLELIEKAGLRQMVMRHVGAKKGVIIKSCV